MTNSPTSLGFQSNEMAERAPYSDTNDLLIDDDQDRERFSGILTERKFNTIRLMRVRFGASPEAIASQIQVDLKLVNEVCF
jgi:hypothetical protein